MKVTIDLAKLLVYLIVIGTVIIFIVNLWQMLSNINMPNSAYASTAGGINLGIILYVLKGKQL